MSTPTAASARLGRRSTHGEHLRARRRRGRRSSAMWSSHALLTRRDRRSTVHVLVAGAGRRTRSTRRAGRRRRARGRRRRHGCVSTGPISVTRPRSSRGLNVWTQPIGRSRSWARLTFQPLARICDAVERAAGDRLVDQPAVVQHLRRLVVGDGDQLDHPLGETHLDGRRGAHLDGVTAVHRRASSVDRCRSLQHSRGQGLGRGGVGEPFRLADLVRW